VRSLTRSSRTALSSLGRTRHSPPCPLRPPVGDLASQHRRASHLIIAWTVGGRRAFMTRRERPTLHLASQQAEAAAVARDRVLEFEVFFDREKARLFRALCLVTQPVLRPRSSRRTLSCRCMSSGIASRRWRTRPTTCIDGLEHLPFMASPSALAAKRGDRRDADRRRDLPNRGRGRCRSHPRIPDRRQRAAEVLVDLRGYSSEETGRMLRIRASTVRRPVAAGTTVHRVLGKAAAL
jgi:hypothetical protein